jgi:hypothetical protein
MNAQSLFGLSKLISFVAFGLVTWLYLWPHLRPLERDDALLPLPAHIVASSATTELLVGGTAMTGSHSDSAKN